MDGHKIVGILWLMGIVMGAQAEDMPTSVIDVEGFEKQMGKVPHAPSLRGGTRLAQADLLLTGIVYHSKKQFALISGQILQVGERIGESTVVRIGRDEVVLKNEDGIFHLTLKGRK